MSGSSNFNIKSDHIRQKLSDLDIAVSDKYEEAVSHLPDKIQKLMPGVHITAMIAVLCIAIFAALAVIFSGPSAEQQALLAQKGTVYLRVVPGMSSDDIGKMLEQHGVIENRRKFWFISKINGFDDKFKTGVYAFSHDMDPREALQMLVSGTTSTMKFTIPEGFTVMQIAKRLSDEGIVNEDEFLRKAKVYAPYNYIDSNSDVKYRAEGFLFPDTYEVHGDGSVDDILKMMSENFDNRLTGQMRRRAKEEGLSIYELVILASIVEKEARYEEDRPIIAQVLMKRLKIGMPLQSDATLQYLMDAPKEDVSIADTKIDSPYNSYQHVGLPPGPVACPGMAAIKAVLHPADTNYLYFVADRSGHNHYSYTYSEHQKIVNEVR